MKRTDLFFLDGLIDEVGRPESCLLRNLLGFYCMSKLLREGNMCDGDVIEDEVEATCALGQIFTNQTRNLIFSLRWRSLSHKEGRMTDMFSLGDELAGVELRNNTFEYLIHYGGKYPLVIILAKLAENCGQCRSVGSGQDTAGDVDHLKICGRGIEFLSEDVENKRLPFVPVKLAIFRGFARISKMIGDSNQGIFHDSRKSEEREFDQAYHQMGSFVVNIFFDTI